MQRRVALWILGAFQMSPSSGIKTIIGFILINFHIQKLNSGFHLRVHTLLANYIIMPLLETRPISNIKVHQLSLERLMPKQ